MDKITKFLKKLSPSEPNIIIELIQQILKKETQNLNPKKLQDFPNLYRIRKNKIRIIYKEEKSKTQIISIDHRNKVDKDL